MQAAEAVPMTAATMVLAVAMLGGLALVFAYWRGVRVRASAAHAHGLAAVLGVVTLAVMVFAADATPLTVNAALLCFAFAFVGGVFNLLFRLQGERPPLFMIALHALAALIGLLLLVVAQ